ncbi:MAG: carbamoyl-phosphate synthase large subunit [Gammaproteobacteria bacterium]|nr:carbamoyl-phosphate synthase large subunit [Gammaproteobacteria bacterium]MBU1507261.1 carbamoyl-phosphate synthase large subunit [Gammaproteobacteria bacterium]MBU2123479.1 carbamoyl-phosphate synthase large subunit [Gammaproteobacteria bacterium]MBU2171134.1 carbamoyl-phosphate synthase large subunit [Gammaproteobacteria bacterium]MBU2201710.1 carbamoyl-phosphate synthase large subunit [Gammaproteobacteria bacterium]
MFAKVLVANRGEIALRTVRALHDLGIASVAVYADDDAASPHVHAASAAVALGATGPAAYLDGARLIAIAKAQGCDAVHPGYGFLSERADFARACAEAGLRFIGPTPAQLALFGDKAQARALAQRQGVPLMPGTQTAVTLQEAQAFFAQHAHAGIVIKAIGGGGGRGMRAVASADDLPAAYARCRSEAQAAFGVDGVYVERLMGNARHIEVQVLGDGREVIALGERECTLQRRFQKVVEIAPSPSLPGTSRERITTAALSMARAVDYQGLGTFEFLVDLASADLPFVFIECNPRLQVEHTITEEVTGVDLVQAQIALAAGRTLQDIGLDPAAPPAVLGFAVQWRINAETLDAQGNATPGSGTLSRFDLPAGPGVRVDTHGAAGATPSPHYDTLLAKLIVHTRSPRFADALRRSQRALAECRIDGVATNLALLQALATRPEMESQQVHTRWLESVLRELLIAAKYIAIKADSTDAIGQKDLRIASEAPEGAVLAPMPARLVQMSVAEGEVVAAGAELAVLEAMKMEHVLLAPHAGRVGTLLAVAGGYVAQGQPLLVLDAVDEAADVEVQGSAAHDPDHIRADLQRVIDRHAFTLDAARPDAMAKRHAQGVRSARENIADLCDDGSFIEYGALAIAAQTRRRSKEDLIANTPADGMVTGIGGINGALFGEEKSRAVVMSYDATVLAGTQGARNHAKTDRMLGIALAQKLPVVLFAEGGGGRPGDTDMPIVAGLHVHTFASYAALSGQVPVIGIAAGRCFAGNAALLGCSDVIIATRASNIGMGGPAMIEGGGLGVFKPEQVGPSRVQHANGVIDVLVDDEAGAVQAARHYLSFFQGRTSEWSAPDQRLLRAVVPENRLRVYDTRTAMAGLVDEGSLLLLRTGFGAGIHTALARIEGRPVGLLANNPQHLGGAIDADAADKCARFMQLCNAHGLPIVSLVDTPGFMVGPEVEATAQVRHVSRLFVTAASLRVPTFSVVLRKGYGLGAMGMTAGGFHAPVFTLAWPTGEFGAMGLEGAVRLGFRKELETLPEGAERDALFAKLLAKSYANGEAMHMAATLEIDAVIDPADTRAWLARGLASAQVEPLGHRFVDTW